MISNEELTYLELDSKYYLEKPVDRNLLQKLVDEVRHWRELGDSPADVEDRITSLEYDLAEAQDELADYARAEARRFERS